MFHSFERPADLNGKKPNGIPDQLVEDQVAKIRKFDGAK
jgi:hypothetical protein